MLNHSDFASFRGKPNALGARITARRLIPTIVQGSAAVLEGVLTFIKNYNA